MSRTAVAADASSLAPAGAAPTTRPSASLDLWFVRNLLWCFIAVWTLLAISSTARATTAVGTVFTTSTLPIAFAQDEVRHTGHGLLVALKQANDSSCHSHSTGGSGP